VASSGTVSVGLKLLYERQGERIAFPIEDGETFVGRKDYCDICFPDQSVSKRHIRIVRAGSKVELFDAGSRNGTLVNGQVVDRVALRDGDVIQLGKITLTVSGGDASSLKHESRASAKSRDSFKDFDDFDEGTDDSEAVPEAAPAKKPSKKTGPRSQASANEPKSGRVESDRRSQGGSAAPEGPSTGDSAARASSELPAKARFTIVGGDGKGKVFELTADKPLTLGTKEENNIALKGDGISRYHAEVVLENDAWVLKDLGSRNGTFVADRKVDLHELAPGDVVMIGNVYLRFDQDLAAGPARPIGEQAKELLELLKRDPKGFLKSSSGRRAIMIVLSVIIAFVLLAPNGDDRTDKGGDGGTDEGTLPHQVIDDLKKEQAQRARDLIARARSTFKPGQDRPYLQCLDDLAKIWVDHNAPLTFEWKGAIAALDKCLKEGKSEIDADCQEWLSQALKQVQDEEPASRLISKGGSELTTAQNLARRGETKDAIANFKLAYKTFREIPKRSVLYGPAQTQCEKARVSVFRLDQKEADRLVAIDPPPWQDAIDRLNEAIEYGSSLEEKTPVRKKIEEYQANQRDEDAFARAVDIVQQRRTQDYDRAIELLNGIARPSRVYPDAQTYLHWIQADRDVRTAKVAYDEGNWEKARLLLEAALRVSELGPEAKSSVTRRLDLWGSVVQSLAEGQALEERGDDVNALARFENVLKLEPSAKNRYHVVAAGEIDNIRDRGDKWIDQKLQEGMESLDKGRYKEAYERFKFVVTRSKQDRVRRAKIENAVKERNQRLHLYQDCYKRWITNESAMYDGLLDTLLLLGTYLPIEDPERPKSRDLYRKVKERLKTAMDQSKQDDEDPK
jgi:pSer/pThr/pTyr-binding forkhead associated (FHA) protein